MTTWNHAYSLAFAVSGSHYEDWEEAMKNEKDFIIEALLRRVKEIRGNNFEFMEALEGFDTYEEV